MKKPVSIKNIILAVVGLLGVIATFLPWLSVSVLGITVSAAGSDGDGWISFVFFLAVLALAVVGVFRKEKWLNIAMTIAAAIALIVVIIKIPDALSNGLTLGVGIYLALIAGVAGVIVPWLPIDKEIK